MLAKKTGFSFWKLRHIGILEMAANLIILPLVLATSMRTSVKMRSNEKDGCRERTGNADKKNALIHREREREYQILLFTISSVIKKSRVPCSHASMATIPPPVSWSLNNSCFSLIY